MYLQVQVHVRYLAAQIFQTCKGAALDSPVQFDLGINSSLAELAVEQEILAVIRIPVLARYLRPTVPLKINFL